MKHYSSHNPNDAYVPPVLPVDVGVRGLLRARAESSPPPPPARTLVAQTPEVVGWLREAMTGRSTVDGDSRVGGKPGSRPPFRVAYMSAADKEVEVLGYWCAMFGFRVSSRAWRVNGVVRGVASDDVSVVDELVGLLLPVLGVVPDGFLNDPRFGVWATRKSHYSIWPELAGLFAPDRFDEPEETNQLELL